MSSFESIVPSSGFKVSASTTAYLKLLFCAVLSAAAELCLKVGAVGGGTDATMNFSALAQAGTWLGIFFFVAQFFVWLHVLRKTPVGVAFAVQSVVQLMVPIGAWALLNEQISAGRALGIALVFAGVLLAAAPSALADERL